jgi:hypothetical protein
MVRLLRRAPVEAALASSSVPLSSTPGVVLEVSGARITVPQGVDRGTLMTVVEVLGAYSRGGVQ